MRAHRKPPKWAIETAAKAVDEQKEAVYRECYQDLGTQFMGMVLYTLDKQYGWKEKRLRDFVEAVRDMSSTLDTRTFRGKADAIDCRKYINDKYGIDLEKEFPMTLEVR